MTLPRRIKSKPSRESDRIRCPGHLKFIREFRCVVRGCYNWPTIAHHVRIGLAGGTSLRPGDDKAVSLCDAHHLTEPGALHQMGEEPFEQKHGLDLVALAQEFAGKSEPLRRYLAKRNRLTRKDK